MINPSCKVLHGENLKKQHDKYSLMVWQCNIIYSMLFNVITPVSSYTTSEEETPLRNTGQSSEKCPVIKRIPNLFYLYHSLFQKYFYVSTIFCLHSVPSGKLILIPTKLSPFFFCGMAGMQGKYKTAILVYLGRTNFKYLGFINVPRPHFPPTNHFT